MKRFPECARRWIETLRHVHEWWGVYSPEEGVAWLNRAAAELVGCPELLERDAMEALHTPEDWVRCNDAAERAFITRRTQVVRYPVRSPLGWLWLEVRINAPRCGRCPTCRVVVLHWCLPRDPRIP